VTFFDVNAPTNIITALFLINIAEAQVNTQEYGRRPYGVGFLVIGQDQSGPHLYEFSPSGTSYEYYAMSIGARSQSAKTYLEKHYESFTDCKIKASFLSLGGHTES
jgi:20S proteasome alpha/beta subunit